MMRYIIIFPALLIISLSLLFFGCSDGVDEESVYLNFGPFSDDFERAVEGEGYIFGVGDLDVDGSYGEVAVVVDGISKGRYTHAGWISPMGPSKRPPRIIEISGKINRLLYLGVFKFNHAKEEGKLFCKRTIDAGSFSLKFKWDGELGTYICEAGSVEQDDEPNP